MYYTFVFHLNVTLQYLLYTNCNIIYKVLRTFATFLTHLYLYKKHLGTHLFYSIWDKLKSSCNVGMGGRIEKTLVMTKVSQVGVIPRGHLVVVGGWVRDPVGFVIRVLPIVHAHTPSSSVCAAVVRIKVQALH